MTLLFTPLGKLYIEGASKKNNQGQANYQFVLNKITKAKPASILVDLERNILNPLSISFNKK
jgi:methyltransferase-like protein